MKTILSFILGLGLIGSLSAQPILQQTVRGIVLDDLLGTPLVGATVRIESGTSVLGGYTDEEGRFAVPGVPIGRATLQVTYIGYLPLTLPNLVVVTGRETVVTLKLTEDLASATKEVVVSAEPVPGKLRNEFSVISSRPFATEEANRFAGSLGDPARMATNFAGVVSAGDTRNDIVVRGNSPLGLLWRLEGVDIPNPNHFSTQGANGGPVSILNNNTLDDSDFLTGAFAPEYGNATAGVFDLKLRSGNTATHENSFQIGFAGFELLSEGPIKSGTTSSYLVGARYSTLSVFDALGISFGDLLGVPNFGDLTLKLDFDLKTRGRLVFFTLGGYSQIDILESELEPEDWNDQDIAESLEFTDIRQRVGSGTAGLRHSWAFTTRSLLSTTLAYSYEGRNLEVDTVFLDQTTGPNFGERYRVGTLQLASSLTTKFSARHSLKSGIFLKRFSYDLQDSVSVFEDNNQFETFTTRDLEESTLLAQAYTQFLWRISAQWSLTSGVHALFFNLNDQFALEPRAALRYQLSPATGLSLGYGMHHQSQVATTYFSVDTLTGEQPNRSMEMTRSQHLVGGVESNLPGGIRLKLEGYYQWLDNIPVDPFPSTYSAANLGANFERPPDRTGFVNAGEATTLGLELTLEKAFTDRYYALITASLFDSRYTPSDGQEYSTAYNNGYVFNALTGVEYPVGKTGRSQVFADLRLAFSGGFRYTPTDLAASQAAGQEVLVPNSAFSEQATPYFRSDLKLGIRQSFRRWSHEFSIQLQNFTNQQNVFTLQYNPRLGQVTERYQLGFFPVPQYKIYF